MQYGPLVKEAPPGYDPRQMQPAPARETTREIVRDEIRTALGELFGPMLEAVKRLTEK